jgi:hypothetical protein
MAPVASGITDGEKNRLILPFGFFKCLITPGIPVYRVISMLQKIGGFLMD